MQRVVWLGYLSLVLAVPLGIGLGSTVGHPGDPPHIFTLLAVVAGGLALAGALREVADPAAGRASRVLVSGGLACFIAITTMSEPFLNFDGSSLKGLLPPSSWLVPVAAAGVWFV
ncbi:MAG TPA: hypothetical protein VE988_23800, partial [Gemmataceae bacterium]|nr:hypothetical protein [Gemmataceae bacterium]